MNKEKQKAILDKWLKAHPLIAEYIEAEEALELMEPEFGEDEFKDGVVNDLRNFVSKEQAKEEMAKCPLGVTVRVGAFLDALEVVKPTLDKKGATAFLYLKAKDNRLTLYSTNLHQETKTSITANVAVEGQVLINPRRIPIALKGFDSSKPLTFFAAPQSYAVSIQAGAVKMSLAANVSVEELGVKADAMPTEADTYITIPTARLNDYARLSTFCIPNDQTGQRANLAVLRVTADGAEATDGSIAVQITSAEKGNCDKSLLIPIKALDTLKTLTKERPGETVCIHNTNKEDIDFIGTVYFTFKDGTQYGCVSPRIHYPNLKPVFDACPSQEAYCAKVPLDKLKASLSRLDPLTSKSNSKRIIEPHFSKDQLTLVARGDEPATDDIPITYEGKTPNKVVKQAYNIGYLQNIAARVNSNTLTLFISEHKEGAKYVDLTVTDHEGEDAERIDIKYVVMGVRVNKNN